MPAAVFLPAYHDDDQLADVVAQALAANPGGLKLCAKPAEHRLAWLPRVLPGWMQIGVADRAGTIHLGPEAA